MVLALVRIALAIVVTIIALIAWAVIGLLVWIPLVVRVTAAFTGTLMFAAIANVRMDVQQEAMAFAFTFYARGFVVVASALSKLYELDYQPPPEAEPDDIWKLFEWPSITRLFHRSLIVLREVAVAVLFWASFGFLFYPVARDRLVELLHRMSGL